MRLQHATIAALALAAGGPCALAQDNPFESLQKFVESLPQRQAVDAADEPAPTPALDAVLDALGSPDLATRETGSAALTDAEAFPDAMLVTAARRDDLSPEQRERVTAALRARFVMGDRPALGIEMEDAPEGVRINGVRPHFPAAQTLKPLDVILAVDEFDLASLPPGPARTDQFRRAIFSREVGESVALVMLRDGEIQRMRVALGRYADLDARLNEPTVRDATMGLAWATRARRLGLAGADEPIRVGVADSVDWLPSFRSIFFTGPGDGLQAGGRPSDAPIRMQLAQGDADRMDARLMLRENAGGRMGQVDAQVQVWQQREAMQRIQRLLEPKLNELRREAAALRERIRQANTPEERAALMESLSEIEAAIQQLGGGR